MKLSLMLLMLHCKWVLIIMGIVLIPTTFFSYVPGLVQKGVMSGSGGCTAVARGTGPLAAKWPFALVNLVRPCSFAWVSLLIMDVDFRHGGLCSRFHQAHHESTAWTEVRILHVQLCINALSFGYSVVSNILLAE